MVVLVLAGGFDQIALVKELKMRGHTVLLADYFKNPIAKEFADKHFEVSTLDEDGIYQLAKKEDVQLITTACTDQALMTVARVSEKMNLPCYISAETARNVTNKAYMKQKFAEYDIPTAKWAIIENEDSFLNSIPNILNYPIIVKPCDCNSSKGVAKVNDETEMIQAIHHAFALSRSKKVLVEEYIEGEEISIDVWKDSEGAKVLSVSGTKKIKDNFDHFTIYQSRYPVELSETVVNKIYDTANRICEVFLLDNCPVLIQAIIKGDALSVIEFSARMGGGSKYKLIEYMSGIDIMKIYVNRVLGNVSQIVTPCRSDKEIELDYVYTYNGKVNKMLGFKEAKESGAIKELFQYQPMGSVTEKMTTSSDRVAGFLIESETKEQLNYLRKTIVNSVDIYNENNESIMFKKCFFEER